MTGTTWNNNMHTRRFKSHLQSRGNGMQHIRQQVWFHQLNKKQQLAHNTFLTSIVQAAQTSSTDGGAGIGCLQLLLGKGGCGKSFALNGMITTVASSENHSTEKCVSTGDNWQGSMQHQWCNNILVLRRAWTPLRPTMVSGAQRKYS